MGQSGANPDTPKPGQMLDTFFSVGAARVDVTWTNAAGDKERFLSYLRVGLFAGFA
jgi:hypothetical protein